VCLYLEKRGDLKCPLTLILSPFLGARKKGTNLFDGHASPDPVYKTFKGSIPPFSKREARRDFMYLKIPLPPFPKAHLGFQWVDG